MCMCVCIRRTGSSHSVLSFLILCYHVLQTGRGDDDGDDEGGGGGRRNKKNNNNKETNRKKLNKNYDKNET